MSLVWQVPESLFILVYKVPYLETQPVGLLGTSMALKH